MNKIIISLMIVCLLVSITSVSAQDNSNDNLFGWIYNTISGIWEYIIHGKIIASTSENPNNYVETSSKWIVPHTTDTEDFEIYIEDKHDKNSIMGLKLKDNVDKDKYKEDKNVYDDKGNKLKQVKKKKDVYLFTCEKKECKIGEQSTVFEYIEDDVRYLDIYDNDNNLVAELELMSPYNVPAVRGSNRLVGWFKIISYSDENDVLGIVNAINLGFENRIEDRNIILRYQDNTQQEQKTLYNSVCDDNYITNLTHSNFNQPNCYNEVTGYEMVNKTNWIDFTDNSLPNNETIIGVFADVNPGDYMDWVAELYGVEITPWATWTESFNTDLTDYWTFNDGTGTNVLNSINGSHNGTFLSSASWNDESNCMHGGCAHLGGGTDQINFTYIPSFYGVTAEYTFNYWINFTSSSPGATGRIWAYNDHSGLDGQHEIYIFGTQIHYNIGSDSGVEQIDTSQSFSANDWTMITFVKNATNIKVFKDGSLVYTGAQQGSVFSPSHWLIANLRDGSDTLVIDYDDVSIWSRELSSSELTDLYNGSYGLEYVPPIGDIDYPIFSNEVINPVNNSDYDSTQNYQFNITVTHTNGTVGLDLNGVNYTATNTSNMFNVTIDSLNVGNYNYYWWGYGNGTTTLFNLSDTQIYSVKDFAEVTLNSPGDASTSAITSIDFNCTAQTGGILDVVNVSLYINSTGTWGKNETKLALHPTMSNNLLYNNVTEMTTTTGTNYDVEINNLIDYVNVSIRNGGGGTAGSVVRFDYSNGSYYEATNSTDGTDYVQKKHYNPYTFLYVSNITISLTATLGIGSFLNNTNIYGGNYTSNNYTTVFTKVISGNTLWTCEACTSDNNCNAGENRTVTIDLTKPTVELYSPNGTISYGANSSSLYLNWTVNDFSLDTCWYQYAGINTTVTCNDNTTIFNSVTDYANLTFYVNDTASNLNSNFTSWDYLIYEDSKSYSALVNSGGSSNFIIGITSGLSLNSGSIVYNGSSESISNITDLGGGIYLLQKDINAPTVEGNSNVSFYWSFNLSDNNVYNSTINYQVVAPIYIDDCSLYPNLLLNYTLMDELTKQVISNNDNMYTKVNVLVYDGDYSALAINYSVNSLVNNTKICISNDLTTLLYYMDVVAQYDGGDSYTGKFNNIQKKLLDSTTIPVNVILYDLDNDNSTEFKVTFKDDNFIRKGNVLVDVTRKYIEEGSFRSVEVAKTDTQGESVIHLQLSDAIYTIYFTYLGEVLAVLDNVVAKCQNPLYSECNIDVNSYSTSTTLPDFSYVNGISASLTFDEPTSTVSSSFNTLSGTSTLLLNVTKFDRLGNTTICSDILTSSSGTLSCLVLGSYGNVTLLSQLYSNGELVQSRIFTINPYNPDNTGTTIILAIMIVITLSMLFISDVRGILLGCFLGLILSGGLLYLNSGNLFSQGSAIMWILVAIIILIWKINSREEK